MTLLSSSRFPEHGMEPYFYRTELQHTMEELRKAFNLAMPMLMGFALQRDGRVYTSFSVEPVLHYPEQEIPGNYFMRYLYPDSAAAWETLWARQKPGPFDAFHTSQWFQTRQGYVVPTLSYIVHLSPDLVGIIAISTLLMDDIETHRLHQGITALIQRKRESSD